MDSLPVISSPPAQRWREFRFHALPLMVFVVSLAAVFFLWRYYVNPADLVGQVEVVSAPVTSPDSGLLTNLFVALHSSVKQGDLVAEVDTTMRYRQDLVREQTQLAQMEIDPVLAQQRNLLDFHRLKMDLAEQEVSLATAQINQQRARDELKRKTELFREKLVTESDFELARTTKETLDAEVEKRSLLVGDLRRTLEQFGFLGNTAPLKPNHDPAQMAQILREQRHNLNDVQLKPLALCAPIAGLVTMVYRKVGETILAGEPIVVITSTNADRVVTFVRQPIPAHLQAGLPVSIRTRAFRRETIPANVLRVGNQFEVISTVLLRPGLTLELGLPIWIHLPSNTGLKPGELVDLSLSDSAN